jgi:hypothetical protein
MYISSIQRFAGNPINGSVFDKKSPTLIFDMISRPGSQWILYRNGKVMFNKVENSFILKIFSFEEIMKLLSLPSIIQFLDEQEENVIVLGEKMNSPYLSLNISLFSASKTCEEISPNSIELDSRKLLVEVSLEDAAIAGQIISIFSFHKSNTFLSINGNLLPITT